VAQLVLKTACPASAASAPSGFVKPEYSGGTSASNVPGSAVLAACGVPQAPSIPARKTTKNRILFMLVSFKTP
jgi:hypothetical protein